ncbi:MAG: hypothetical protein GX754_06225 [Clostridiaceae bacterium]|nr:hypothetical protein [Clostridiaceae bacterium]
MKFGVEEVGIDVEPGIYRTYEELKSSLEEGAILYGGGIYRTYEELK